jgi:hypothetical protein
MVTATIEMDNTEKAVSSNNNNKDKRRESWEGTDDVGTRVDDNINDEEERDGTREAVDDVDDIRKKG